MNDTSCPNLHEFAESLSSKVKLSYFMEFLASIGIAVTFVATMMQFATRWMATQSAHVVSENNLIPIHSETFNSIIISNNWSIFSLSLLFGMIIVWMLYIDFDCHYKKIKGFRFTEKSQKFYFLAMVGTLLSGITLNLVISFNLIFPEFVILSLS